MMKKRVCLFLTILLLLGSFTACNVSKPEKKEENTASEYETEVDGIWLTDHPVTLNLACTDEEIEVTQDSLLTNSTKITVSADIADETEIEVHLYQADDTSSSIAVAQLSREKKKVEFTNLTAAEAYKVGATAKNTDAPICITITE